MEMTQYAIATDLNRCTGCLACSVACKVINDVEPGNFWNKTLRIGPNPKTDGAVWPDVEMYFLMVQCQHCNKPCCVEVCPTEASHKVEDGTVQINKEKCIGCQFCVMACPYGVRYLNEEERVVEKCTLCEQRVIEGYLPQCVAQCGARARYFGDLDKGIETFEAPYFCDPDDQANATKAVEYDTMVDTYRITLAEVVARNEELSGKAEFDSSNVHHLPDVGNGPSMRYIMRHRTWRGATE
jgi:Fe-S-cluster-containing dehydrogenase component